MGFNYQAQIRNDVGVLIPDSLVRLRFTILPSEFSTTPSWVEDHQQMTDKYGMVNLVIGQGVRVGGTSSSFDQINFGISNHWLRVQIDNGSGFVNLGNDEPFQSVPYAKVAGNASFIPPGFIMAYGADTSRIPAGWLLCDGREIARSTYSELYQIIGDGWGRGDNSTTFNLPDLRGQFLRGVTLNSNDDPDANSVVRTAKYSGGNMGNSVGSYQLDEFKSHNHQIVNNGFVGVNSTIVGGGLPPGNIGAFTERTGGNESRPKNAYVHFLIKY